jgi:hypothetical protein
MLRDGGTFVAKFFKGADLSYLEVMMKQLFKDVYVLKPESSRSSSAEAFVVGINYMTGLNVASVLSKSMQGLRNDLTVKHVPEVIKIPTASNEDEEFSFGVKKAEPESIKEENAEIEDSEEDVLTF